jgi:hypothetical protein
MLLEIFWTIEFSPSLVPAKAPASPRRGFLFAQAGSVAIQKILEFQKHRER